VPCPILRAPSSKRARELGHPWETDSCDPWLAACRAIGLPRALRAWVQCVGAGAGVEAEWQSRGPGPGRSCGTEQRRLESDFAIRRWVCLNGMLSGLEACGLLSGHVCGRKAACEQLSRLFRAQPLARRWCGPGLTPAPVICNPASGKVYLGQLSGRSPDVVG